MNNDYHSIDYKYVYFNFSYTWLRDKQIIHKGDWRGGVLIIADEEGRQLKVYGYSLVDAV